MLMVFNELKETIKWSEKHIREEKTKIRSDRNVADVESPSRRFTAAEEILVRLDKRQEASRKQQNMVKRLKRNENYTRELWNKFTETMEESSKSLRNKKVTLMKSH